MKLATTTLALVAAIAAGSCVTPAPLYFQATRRLAKSPVAGTIVVRMPRDLRPALEREGAKASFKTVVPLLPIFWYSDARGSDLTGAGDFSPDAFGQLQRSLHSQLQASGVFRAVRTQGAGDYVLETDVLHLVAGRYTAMRSIGFFAVIFSFRRFMPVGTVVLRLRLRDRQGQIIGQKIVRSTHQAGPKVKRLRLGFVARRALSRALVKAQAMVTSWIFAENASRYTPAQWSAYVDRGHQRRHTFLTHSVSRDRLAIAFRKVECPSGRILRTWVVSASQMRVVGRPGHWLLSPYTDTGVQIARPLYAALSKHLSQHFVLRRVDQINTYHYFGRRTAPTPPATPPPPPATSGQHP